MTTSTFVIHHDKCDPSKWTVREWLTLADYIKTGSLAYAARLSRSGMQLVLDERHAPKGGELECVGWRACDDFVILDTLLDADMTFGEVMEVQEVYLGPRRYAANYFVGDDCGTCEEYETFDTEDEAEKFIAGLKNTSPIPTHQENKTDN